MNVCLDFVTPCWEEGALQALTRGGGVDRPREFINGKAILGTLLDEILQYFLQREIKSIRAGKVL